MPPEVCRVPEIPTRSRGVSSGPDGFDDQVRTRYVERGLGFVNPLHHPVPIDQDQRPVGMTGRTEVGAIGIGDRAFGLEIGQQRGFDAELVAEGFVGEGGIDADTEQRDVSVIEIPLDRLVLRELVRADRAEIQRIEGEQNPAAGKVRQRNLLAGVVREGEIRSLGSDFNQWRRPRSATSER